LGGGQERSYRVFHNTEFRTIATLFEKKVPNVDNFLGNAPEEESVCCGIKRPRRWLL
jgi:hypothetical protein